MPGRPIRRMPDNMHIDGRVQSAGGIRTDSAHAANMGKATFFRSTALRTLERQAREIKALEEKHNLERQGLNEKREELLDTARGDYALTREELIERNREIVEAIRRKAIGDKDLDSLDPAERRVVEDSVLEIIGREKRLNYVNLPSLALGLAIALSGPKANREKVSELYNKFMGVREHTDLRSAQDNSLIMEAHKALDLPIEYSSILGVSLPILVYILISAAKKNLRNKVIYERLIRPEQELEQASYNALVKETDFETEEEN